MLKDKVIDEIISRLIPLRTLYKEEIDTITNDLINDKFQSLYAFIDKYYQDEFYSEYFQLFLEALNKNGQIPSDILKGINFENQKHNSLETTKPSNLNLPNYIQETTLDFNNLALIGFRPINLKIKNWLRLKENLKDENDTFTEQEIPSLELPKEEEIEDEYLSLEETDFQKLKKSIINAQLNYLNNAPAFILDLEKKEAVDIYKALINLSNVSYIHHCISKLSSNTLDRLLQFMEERLKNTPSQIDLFIEKAIKLHLNPPKRMQ